MSKRKAPANTYWRGDTLFARFTIAGKRYRESLYTGDVTAAKRRVAKMIADATAERRFGEAPRTWEHAVAAWADHIMQAVGKATAKRYATSLEQCRPWLTGRPVEAIDKACINALVTGRMHDPAKRKISNATIRRDLTAIASVLDYAIEHDWTDRNPARQKAAVLRERRDPIVLPTDASIRYLLARADPVWIHLINAARFTGCRLSELTGLRRRDLNADMATLVVIGKGNKRRSLDLTPQAIASLSAMPASTTTQAIFHYDGNPLKFVSERFQDMSKRAQKAAQKEGAEFARFRFHDLRHLYAVEYLRAGGSLYDLQQQLGHSSIATTEHYLAFMTPEEAKIAKGRKIVA